MAVFRRRGNRAVEDGIQRATALATRVFLGWHGAARYHTPRPSISPDGGGGAVGRSLGDRINEWNQRRCCERLKQPCTAGTRSTAAESRAVASSIQLSRVWRRRGNELGCVAHSRGGQLAGGSRPGTPSVLHKESADRRKLDDASGPGTCHRGQHRLRPVCRRRGRT